MHLRRAIHTNANHPAGSRRTNADTKQARSIQHAFLHEELLHAGYFGRHGFESSIFRIQRHSEQDPVDCRAACRQEIPVTANFDPSSDERILQQAARQTQV